MGAIGHFVMAGSTHTLGLYIVSLLMVAIVNIVPYLQRIGIHLVYSSIGHSLNGLRYTR